MPMPDAMRDRNAFVAAVFGAGPGNVYDVGVVRQQTTGYILDSIQGYSLYASALSSSSATDRVCVKIVLRMQFFGMGTTTCPVTS